MHNYIDGCIEIYIVGYKLDVIWGLDCEVLYDST